MACSRCGSRSAALQQRLTKAMGVPVAKVSTGRIVNPSTVRPALLDRVKAEEAKKDG